MTALAWLFQGDAGFIVYGDIEPPRKLFYAIDGDPGS